MISTVQVVVCSLRRTPILCTSDNLVQPRMFSTVQVPTSVCNVGRGTAGRRGCHLRLARACKRGSVAGAGVCAFRPVIQWYAQLAANKSRLAKVAFKPHNQLKMIIIKTLLTYFAENSGFIFQPADYGCRCAQESSPGPTDVGTQEGGDHQLHPQMHARLHSRR